MSNAAPACGGLGGNGTSLASKKVHSLGGGGLVAASLKLHALQNECQQMILASKQIIKDSQTSYLFLFYLI